MVLKQRGWYYVSMEVMGKTDDKPPVNPPSLSISPSEKETKKNLKDLTQKGFDLKALSATDKNVPGDSTPMSKETNEKQVLSEPAVLNAVKKVVVFFGVYLERDICVDFKLDKLKLLSPENSKTALKGVSLLKIHTKNDSVRLGAFQLWKATFYKIPDDEKKNDDPATWPELNMAFTLSSAVQKQELEDHCVALKEITYKKTKLTYKTGSIRAQGGRSKLV